jgi:DNA (cytosine-5)-methyltransferase 1
VRVLNLYAGIGGNRKLWTDCEVTAVENVQYIADAYKQLYPDDTVVVADAHQYLLDHHKEFDFIWSSPPCPTHSKFNTTLYTQGYIRYPDMTLYQEILFLSHFYKGRWVVENVESYYDPLIRPQRIARHYFWSKYHIPKFTGKSTKIEYTEPEELAAGLGLDVSFIKNRLQRRTVLRNAVQPELGLHVFNAVGLRNSETVTGENLSLALASSLPAQPTTKGEKK